MARELKYDFSVRRKTKIYTILMLPIRSRPKSGELHPIALFFARAGTTVPAILFILINMEI